MLQGPFKLTVTASINPLFVESQPGGNRGEEELGHLGLVLCSHLCHCPWHDLAEEASLVEEIQADLGDLHPTPAFVAHSLGQVGSLLKPKPSSSLSRFGVITESSGWENPLRSSSPT